MLTESQDIIPRKCHNPRSLSTTLIGQSQTCYCTWCLQVFCCSSTSTSIMVCINGFCMRLVGNQIIYQVGVHIYGHHIRGQTTTTTTTTHAIVSVTLVPYKWCSWCTHYRLQNNITSSILLQCKCSLSDSIFWGSKEDLAISREHLQITPSNDKYGRYPSIDGTVGVLESVATVKGGEVDDMPWNTTRQPVPH